jgi:hypothetical protein
VSGRDSAIRWEAFTSLCGYLRAGLLGGERQPTNRSVPWELLIEASSYHFVTPALGWCLMQQLSAPPHEVRQYFEEIVALNTERNEKLVMGLASIVNALNAIDIEPVLLKGAARLIEGTYPEPMLRFLGDLDVLIPASRSAAAVAALNSIGFRVHPDDALLQASHHHLPMLYDPETGVGVELHTSLLPPEHASLLPTDWFNMNTRRYPFRDVTIRLPDATRSVGHIIAHDQLSHGRHWQRRVELRQLLDLAMIRAKSETAIDWSELDDRFCRMGFGTLLATYMDFARRLLGQPLPQLKHAALPGATAVFRWTIESSRLQPWGAVALRAISFFAQCSRDPRAAMRLFHWDAWRYQIEEVRRKLKSPPSW